MTSLCLWKNAFLIELPSKKHLQIFCWIQMELIYAVSIILWIFTTLIWSHLFCSQFSIHELSLTVSLHHSPKHIYASFPYELPPWRSVIPLVSEQALLVIRPKKRKRLRARKTEHVWQLMKVAFMSETDSNRLISPMMQSIMKWLDWTTLYLGLKTLWYSVSYKKLE